MFAEQLELYLYKQKKQSQWRFKKIILNNHVLNKNQFKTSIWKLTHLKSKLNLIEYIIFRSIQSISSLIGFM